MEIRAVSRPDRGSGSRESCRRVDVGISMNLARSRVLGEAWAGVCRPRRLPGPVSHVWNGSGAARIARGVPPSPNHRPIIGDDCPTMMCIALTALGIAQWVPRSPLRCPRAAQCRRFARTEDLAKAISNPSYEADSIHDLGRLQVGKAAGLARFGPIWPVRARRRAAPAGAARGRCRACIRKRQRPLGRGRRDILRQRREFCYCGPAIAAGSRPGGGFW
jgi:hypothetical protein